MAIEMPRPRQRGVAPWAPGSLDAERSPRPGLQGAAVLMSHLPRPFADLNQENDPRVTREAAFGVGEEQGVVLGGGGPSLVIWHLRALRGSSWERREGLRDAIQREK